VGQGKAMAIIPQSSPLEGFGNSIMDEPY